MKCFISIVSILTAVIGMVSGNGPPTSGAPVILITYDDGKVQSFKNAECIPFRHNGSKIDKFTVSQSITCYSHGNPDCTGERFPSPVVFPDTEGIQVYNAADFAEDFGESGRCYKNALPA